jgi:hypothetical protein
MVDACGDKGIVTETPEGGVLSVREGRKIWDYNWTNLTWFEKH